MHRWYRTLVVILASLASGFAFSACNTVEGVGEDVQSAGEGIEDAAEGAK